MTDACARPCIVESDGARRPFLHATRRPHASVTAYTLKMTAFLLCLPEPLTIGLGSDSLEVTRGLPGCVPVAVAGSRLFSSSIFARVVGEMEIPS